MLLITLCLVLISSHGINTQFFKKCNDCVPVDTCQPNPGTESKSEFIQKLRNSNCGYEKSKPMVCCSEFNPTSPATPTLATTQPSSRIKEVLPDPTINEDVTKHANFGLLPTNCGDINGERLVGGTIAGLNEFPWMALLGYTYDVEENIVEFRCSGSLITDRYVVTAAHCLIVTLKLVRLGEHDITSKIDCQGEDESFICQSHIQDVFIENTTQHELYTKRPFTKNDIGLIRIKDAADLSFKNVALICLPVTIAHQNKDLSGNQAIVAGWGRTENGNMSPVLRKVTVPIGNNEDCLNSNFRVPERIENKLCAGEIDKDSCDRDSGGPLILTNKYNKNVSFPISHTGLTKDTSQGDSGGPLMIEDVYNSARRYILYGIVSSGRRDCGSTNFPGLYTDISKYIKWILDNIHN